MMTIVIYGVTVEDVKGGEFAKFLEREQAREREERIDRELREWLRTADPSDPEYSDIFKDVYGFRPRW